LHRRGFLPNSAQTHWGPGPRRRHRHSSRRHRLPALPNLSPAQEYSELCRRECPRYSKSGCGTRRSGSKLCGHRAEEARAAACHPQRHDFSDVSDFPTVGQNGGRPALIRGHHRRRQQKETCQLHLSAAWGGFDERNSLFDKLLQYEIPTSPKLEFQPLAGG
jgi:hypothetical protein